MGYRLKAAVAVLSIAFLAACPESTGPTEDLAVDFEFGVNRLQTEPAFLVNPGTGTITLRGYFETPCSPYSATARAELTDNQITLHVRGVQPDGCWDVIGTVGYQGTIRGIPAGTYAVAASHTYPTTDATTLIIVGTQIVVR